MRFLLFLLLLTGCGMEPVSPILRTLLQEEYNKKLEELREATADHIGGWPSDHDCDGALWAGVARAGGAEWVDMTASLQDDGRPTRRPFRDCATPHESKATTSNDMMTGIILGLLYANDTDSLHDMWRYGTAHGWIMGSPDWYLTRVLLRPNGVSLLARSLYHTSGGQLDYPVRFSPIVYGPSDSDYGVHLALLSRLAQRHAGGPQYGTEITEQLLARSYPRDGLAQAMAGNYNEAATLLLTNYESPSYVRGHHNYHLAHWLLAAHIILES